MHACAYGSCNKDFKKMNIPYRHRSIVIWDSNIGNITSFLKRRKAPQLRNTSN